MCYKNRTSFSSRYINFYLQCREYTNNFISKTFLPQPSAKNQIKLDENSLNVTHETNARRFTITYSKFICFYFPFKSRSKQVKHLKWNWKNIILRMKCFDFGNYFSEKCLNSFLILFLISHQKFINKNLILFSFKQTFPDKNDPNQI